MIASRPDARRIRLRGAAAAAACAVLSVTACLSPAGRPPEHALEPVVHLSIRVPDVADHTASNLALAALRSDREGAERALKSLRAIDTVLEAGEEPPTGLLPVATDLFNTTLDDPRAYREATRALVHTPLFGTSQAVDDATAERLEQAAADDPLLLASKRMNDVEKIEMARLFNTLAEPIGSSILTSVLIPYRLGQSIFNYAVSVSSRDPISVQGRQALAHWRNFLAHHPDAPESEEIHAKVEKQEARWTRTQYLRSLRRARRALEQHRLREAIVYADRALDYKAEDSEATELRDEASDRLLALRRLQERSVAALPSDRGEVALADARDLTLALLAPDGNIASAARDLLTSAPAHPLADEAHYALAIADFESDDPHARERMWDELELLAGRPPHVSNMARHAQALLSPASHPYRAFVEARRRDRWGRFRWIALGAFANGPRNRNLPMPVQWIIDLPAMAQSLVGMPFRLLRWPWQKPLPSSRRTAVHAHLYLEREPEGARSDEVRRWIVNFEKRRDNWVAAHQIAVEQRPSDPKRLAKLGEKAAEQALEAAGREKSRVMRIAMYQRVASEFPETRAGRQAGINARAEVESANATHIQLTRGFLLENPQVAGPRGLGLASHFLDENSRNGELHSEGVALVGGREVLLSFLAPSGDEDDEPVRRNESLSAEHLARVVSLLEETSFHNALVDSDEEIVPDAQRDLFFERARLEIGDEIDWRPGAESTFTYRGMRERYGMVRSRPSILPFELVLRGSLEDFSLGAFPRLHAPRRTADAFLYE